MYSAARRYAYETLRDHRHDSRLTTRDRLAIIGLQIPAVLACWGADSDDRDPELVSRSPVPHDDGMFAEKASIAIAIVIVCCRCIGELFHSP